MHRILTIVSIFLFSLGLQAQVADPDPARFASQIAAFTYQDSCHPPDEDPVLFVGSSSFRMWHDAEQVFSKYHVLNRGFGGSQFSDVLTYFEQLITRYSPRTLVIYEGDNDIAHGKSPQRVLEDFQELENRVLSTLGEIAIAFVSIKPSPSRWDIAPRMMKANELIKAHCERKENLIFIDIWPLMLNAAGNPDKQLYIGDGLHMNPCGYKLWEKEIMQYLESLPPA